MNETTKPKVRTEGVFAELVGTETVVFDTEHNQVHRLNPTMAAIWNAADGTRTVEQIAARVAEHLQIVCSPETVDMGVRQLQSKNLLEGAEISFAPLPSRRELGLKIASLGVSAAALPILASSLAPTPAMARSQVSYTPSQIKSDLWKADITAVQNGKALLNNPAAAEDLADAGQHGLKGLAKYPTDQTVAESLFNDAEQDLSAFYSALGL